MHTRSVTCTAPTGTCDFKWAPDSRHAVGQSGCSNPPVSRVYLVDTQRGNADALIMHELAHGLGRCCVEFSPDSSMVALGQLFLFSDMKPGHVAIHSLSHGSILCVVRPGWQGQFAWHPSCAYIAFFPHGAREFAIYSVADGCQVCTASIGGETDHSWWVGPHWSPACPGHRLCKAWTVGTAIHAF